MATKTLKTLFPRPDALAGADHTSQAGAPSFTHDLREQCLRVLTTGCLTPTFYSSAQEQAKESVEIFERTAQEDSRFLAQAIVYARTEGLLRSVPIVALAVLSKHDPALFRQIFPRVIRTPNDLKDFVALVREGGIRGGLGRSVKTAVNEWMGNLSEYHAIKYGSQGSGFSLRDVLRLTRPQPAGKKQEILFNYLVKGLTDDNFGPIAGNLDQVACFECLKKTDDPIRQIELVREGRLPYEAVTGALKPGMAMWEELMRQMPFFALLRHLNTLHKHGLFTSTNAAKNIAHVVGVLTDPERVRKSMVLPFRYYTAYQAIVADMPRPIQEALETALELSFQNVPTLPGKVCIGPDVSGSMGRVLSEKGTTRYIDICGIFTAALLKRSEDALVLPFDSKIYDNLRFSRNDTMMATTEKLARIQGGATVVGAPAAWLYNHGIKVDTFIGVTDGEDWEQARGWSRGQGFGNIWREYRKAVNPQARAFLLTLSPYQDWMTKQGAEGVSYLYGWSDSTAQYLIREITGQGSQMAAVRAINLITEPGSGDGDAGE